ncbi:hypothetical protein PDESU_03939 [Pontiella desulfatans]|uniref:Uncharacterized protein n=1 Tax=Pontiella desulfatans TaxID=2750659 RepID=A0A6C2U7H4_PONDE|nr:hypothetical protein [Pontiella desulfatans]VGO15356.1 hypothetical protein PDESU_03939 [Pontiella desulfatans]
MEVQKKKKRIVNSSAALISIGIHVLLIVLAGGMVALKFYKKRGAGFQVEDEKPKLERRKLQMPVKTEPFIEQMTKPKLQTTSRITANTPQMVNIPEQGEYVKMAPMPTFKGGYTNFVQMDRTLEFNSKYRDVSFGISSVDFFGTRGKAEKVCVVVDASKSMLYDDRGGIESYQMVHDDLREVIGNMRSATLFNVVLFDEDDVALFNQNMVAATPTAKTNVLEWVGGINTNLALVGLSEGQANYTAKRQYEIPMSTTDVTGWLKGFQAAIEQKPEIIFVLSAEWGNITAPELGMSYFLRRDKFEQYQKKRVQYFLEEEDFKEEWDGYVAEFDQLRKISFKMLQLENQAREEAEMQPKVVRDWDEILYDNNIELPIPPLAKDQQKVGIMPIETRYTLDEVLESFFVIVMDNYRNLGFPNINFVMLQGDGATVDSTVKASMMTSEAKFQNLTKMVGGRFRFLKGMPRIDNYLTQSIDDVLDAIAEDDAAMGEL